MALVLDIVDALAFVRRQQGWHQALKTAWQFVQESFYESHDGYVLRKSITDPIDVPKAEVDLELRQIGLEDLDLLKTVMPAFRVKRIAHKLQAGEICNTAIQNGQVIGFVLAAFESTPSTRQVDLKLYPDEAYLWSGYALPQYRRQGVVKVVNLSLCKLLQEKGYKKVVLCVERTNQASLGHCFKMDYQVTGRILFLRILGWKRCRIIPASMGKD